MGAVGVTDVALVGTDELELVREADPETGADADADADAVLVVAADELSLDAD